MKELDGGGKMCGLDLYSPKTLQLRKERIGGKDSVGGAMERNRRRHGEEEGGPDKRDHVVSDTQ
jgi:hypothetical protein